jgi:hypothetical protein
MKHGFSQVVLLFASVLLPAITAAAETPAISLEEYRQQLRELSAKVDSLSERPEQASTVLSAIPDTVTVRSTGSSKITVSYRDLKDSLAVISKADRQKRAAMLPRAQSYLHRLKEEAGIHDQEAETTAARQKLEDILSRREFRNAQSGPSLGQILLGKVLRWLDRILGRARLGKGTFDLLQVVVYGLVAAVLVLLLVWILRRFRRPREQTSTREIIPFAPSARGWRTWLAEARAQARQQDWRGAIHLAYWAGISFLEEGGAWKPNRARTPREYLRLVGTRGPNFPPLAALTRKFEIVWYGNRDTAESDFNEALGQLEKLGCR